MKVLVRQLLLSAGRRALSNTGEMLSAGYDARLETGDRRRRRHHHRAALRDRLTEVYI